MQNSSIKRFLQSFSARTQFPPFIWLYRWLYHVGVWFCVRRLSSINGVTSVYLRRGLTTGRPLYGLSDIDLLVMVNGDNRTRVAARVHYEYELLCRRVPMLARGELALYDPEEFQTLYEHSPFYRNRFEQGRYEWRRLSGDDIFKHLPSASNEIQLLAVQELMPAWNYLVEELMPNDKRPLYLRKYVAYKAIGEAAKAALITGGQDSSVSRDTALYRADRIFAEIREALREVQGWRKNLVKPLLISENSKFDSFLFLAHKTLTAIPRGTRPQYNLRLGQLSPQEAELLLGEGALTEIEEACARLEEVERGVLIPRLNFASLASLGLNPDMFTGATVDALDLVLVGSSLPPVEKLRQLNQVLEGLFPAVNPFFCDGRVGAALRPIGGESMKDSISSPEFFAPLTSTTTLHGCLEMGGSVDVSRSFEREDSLENRARSFLALFEKPEVFRLPVRSFFTLFWEAARAAYLEIQPKESAIQIPVSSSQILDAIANLTPEETPVLKRIHKEYCRETRDEPSEAVRFVGWASLYIQKLKVLLFGEEDAVLPSEARKELTISVLIVTRNRADLLRRALHSLVEQERPPDEVIVVDNASTDETRFVAESFVGRLKLKLSYEKKVGIPHARNTGLKNCTKDIIAVMDDDCLADRRWLAELEFPFLKDPLIGAVGGSLLPMDGEETLIARFYDSRMGPDLV